MIILFYVDSCLLLYLVIKGCCPILAVTRKSEIRDIVLEKKSVVVSDLALKFGVAEETIRRDLKALEEEGILQRTYGGAYVQDGVENDINMKIRETLFLDSKQAIAAKAKENIQNGDSIFLDSSTTALAIASLLQDMRITVVTNSLKISNTVAEFEGVKLITIGGKYFKNNEAFLGSSAIKTLSNYNLDKAFVSCRSLSMENGISDSFEELAELRLSVLDHAVKKFLIADYTKFNRASFIKICGFSKIDYLITDSSLSFEWVSFLNSQNVVII